MTTPRPARQAGAVVAAAVIGALTLTGLSHSGQTEPRPAAGGPPLQVAPESPRRLAARPVTLEAPAGPRPNILMFTVDDMTIGDLPYMPRLNRLVVQRGTRLSQGTAPTPICVPARASLLTGQYAHNHGARTIDGPKGGFQAFRDRSTLPVWLRRAGYETFFAGKYLNGYGEQDPGYIPPGWSGWRGAVDMSTYDFHDTLYNIDGDVGPRSEHNSDVLDGFTTEVIGGRAGSSKPWFMWTNFVAPHHGGAVESDDPPVTLVPTTMPAARDRNAFRHLGLPRDPEMWRAGVNPWAPRTTTPAYRAAVREAHQQRIESLQSVDRAVGAAMRALRTTGQLRNTYVIFTSDNGYLLGHHNKDGKLFPFDRSLRVPMIVRGPGIPKGRTVATPTTNPDLAVTIAGIAGAAPGRRVDGVNMLRFWRSPTDYDRIVPIEGYPVRDGRTRLYSGIRQGPWTYVLTRGGREILFNRAQDPGELRNLARRRRFAAPLARLRELNRRYRDCAGSNCPKRETFVAR